MEEEVALRATVGRAGDDGGFAACAVRLDVSFLEFVEFQVMGMAKMLVFHSFPLWFSSVVSVYFFDKVIESTY